MDPIFLKEIRNRIDQWEHPKHTALSQRVPLLRSPLIIVRRVLRKGRNLCDRQIARQQGYVPLPCIIARHQSVLLRTLGDSDMRLQRGKIRNIAAALPSLQYLLIRPGETFSFWETVGKPTTRRGFVPGMLLSNGTVIEGVGGGLCQLSNFLHWLLLHGETEIVEHHHHSLDVFPDSGRVLPFGSGATVFYNYVDLKVRNSSSHPLQLCLWLTNTHLKGRLLSDAPAVRKFHIEERNHCFVRSGTRLFRCNELWRETRVQGNTIDESLLTRTVAPVLYAMEEEELRRRGMITLDEHA